jgi:hypothetical protein
VKTPEGEKNHKKERKTDQRFGQVLKWKERKNGKMLREEIVV